MDPEQLEEYKEAFTIFDKDGSGCISVEELGNVFVTLGHECTEEEVADMVKSVDVDGNNEVDFGEFCTLMANIA